MCGSWQGIQIRGLIRILAVNWASIVDCSKDDGKCAADATSDEMVSGAVRPLWEFSLLVSQQNHSNVSLTEIDDPQRCVFEKKGVFQEQKMLKSVKAKVD